MLQQMINDKWKEAFKAKNTVLKSAYECVKAKILVEEKSGKYELPLSDEVILNILIKEVKELKETQTFYKTEDNKYIEIQLKIDALSEYLPKQLTVEEVQNIINKIVAGGETNIGRITGLVVKEVGSRFDKSKISSLVREVMSQGV